MSPRRTRKEPNPGELPIDEAWDVIRDRIRSRRLELGLTQAQAAEKGGFSLATWNLLESGPQLGFRAITLAGAERALGWRHGAIELMLEGLPPEEIGPRQPQDDEIDVDAITFENESLLQHLDNLKAEIDRMRELVEAENDRVRRRGTGST